MFSRNNRFEITWITFLKFVFTYFRSFCSIFNNRFETFCLESPCLELPCFALQHAGFGVTTPFWNQQPNSSNVAFPKDWNICIKDAVGTTSLYWKYSQQRSGTGPWKIFQGLWPSQGGRSQKWIWLRGVWRLPVSIVFNLDYLFNVDCIWTQTFRYFLEFLKPTWVNCEISQSCFPKPWYKLSKFANRTYRRGSIGGTSHFVVELRSEWAASRSITVKMASFCLWGFTLTIVPHRESEFSASSRYFSWGRSWRGNPRLVTVRSSREGRRKT